MKYLVKAKNGNTLVSISTGAFLDEYRYRVFASDADIRNWESRKLVDIAGKLKDEATDAEFKNLFDIKGDSAVAEFLDKYGFDVKKAEEETPAPAPKAEPEEVKAEEPAPAPKAEEPQRKKNKYKNR